VNSLRYKELVNSLSYEELVNSLRYKALVNSSNYKAPVNSGYCRRRRGPRMGRPSGPGGQSQSLQGAGDSLQVALEGSKDTLQAVLIGACSLVVRQPCLLRAQP
jgi:hypothetical protein